MVDVATLVVKLTADAKGYISGLKQSGDQTKGFLERVKGFTKALGGVTAGAAIVGATLKKAFALGKVGAQVTQTAQSFDLLMQKIGAAPDILSRLQTESRGTIDDMKLMSATSTLLAGASGQLAQQLANASPELLRIAKAAQKLNPSLGDTAFMYQSISTGIKRASPLILDNLGLMVKVGAANKAYAAELGKTVEQLTAEEQQIALLNATVKAGDVLISQVGGTTESATDSFERLEAATANLSNELKAKLAPHLAIAAEGLVTLLNWTKKVDQALGDARTGITNTSKTYEEYVERMVEAAIVSGKLKHVTVERAKALILAGEAGGLLLENVAALNEEQWEALRLGQQTTDAWLEVARAERELAAAAAEAEAAQASLDDELTRLNELISSTLTRDMLDYGETWNELNDEAGEYQARIDELQAKGEGLTTKEREELDQLNGKLGETQGAIGELEAAFARQTAMMIFNMAQQRLAADGLTAAEFEALNLLAGPEGLGLIDQAAVTAADAVNATLSTFEQTGNLEAFQSELVDINDTLASTATQKAPKLEKSLEKLGGEIDEEAVLAQNLADALNSVPNTVYSDIYITTHYSNITDPGRAGGEARASGGPVQAGFVYEINERGREFFMPQVDGTVIPAGRSAAPSGQSGVGGGQGGLGMDPRAFARILAQELAYTIDRVPRD